MNRSLFYLSIVSLSIYLVIIFSINRVIVLNVNLEKKKILNRKNVASSNSLFYLINSPNTKHAQLIFLFDKQKQQTTEELAWLKLLIITTVVN